MIKFTLLRPEHIDGMTEVESLCFDDPWTRRAFEDELKNAAAVYITAVDEKDNSVVGYAGMWLMVDAADITNVAVHPKWRRQGMASQMLSLLVKIADEKGMDSITLEVRESNLSAKALYESLGFKVCGLRKRYYRDRENAVIMTRMLKNDEVE